MSDMAGYAAGVAVERGETAEIQWSAGTRDIEGKVTRVGASKPGGERVSKRRVTSFLHSRVDRNPIYFPGLAAVC